MITDSQTNVVFFSSLLKTRFPILWDNIEPFLKDRNIDYHFVENSRNIWCRDYMPIQVAENHYVQFQYFPDYYLSPKQVKFLTIQDEIQYDLDIKIKKIDLMVDGGNIVKSRTKAIMTDKVFTDNKKNIQRRSHWKSSEKNSVLTKYLLSPGSQMTGPDMQMGWSGFMMKRPCW